MTSQLFTVASVAVQRTARRKFNRTPIGRLVQQSEQIRTGKASVQQLKRMERKIRGIGGEHLVRQINRAGGPQKYAIDQTVSAALSELLKALGPFGDIIRGVVGASRASTNVTRQLEAAIGLLKAFGVETLPAKGQPGRQRGLDAALQVLEEEGLLGGGRRLSPSRLPATPPVGAPPSELPEEFPPEHDISIMPRVDPEEAGKELLAPQSSNVFGFMFQRESRTRGILYVTFKARAPKGQKRPNRRGPMYAYFDVPVQLFNRMRTAQSKGGFVWDHLRVRGTVWGHQFRYSLVSGESVAGDIYVPRKATERGLRRRALAASGTGKRDYITSQLPERLLSGGPNRGAPNRGRPDRGRPDRGT